MLGLLIKGGTKAAKSYTKLKKSQKKRAAKTAKENAKARPKQDYKKKSKKPSRGRGKASAALLAGATALTANEINKQNKKLDEKYKKKKDK